MTTYINVNTYEEFCECTEILLKKLNATVDWIEDMSTRYHDVLVKPDYQVCLAIYDNLQGPSKVYSYHYNLTESWCTDLKSKDGVIISYQEFLVKDNLTTAMYKALEELEQAIIKKDIYDLDRDK